MSACSPADEVKHLNQQSVSPADENISKSSEQPLQHEDDEERNRQGDDNVHRNTDESGDGDEDEEEEEDLDFNPFLRETHSVQSSSSLSSEVEGLDVDVADSGRNTSAASLKNSKTNHANSVQNYPIGDTEYGKEIVMQTAVSSGEALGKKSDLTSATITERELVFISQSDNGLPCDKKNGLCSRADGSNPADSRKLIMGVDPEDAICMRTRARYSLASFTLDELETFLQETDDEDDLQNVDDEREYRKFLAAVLLGVDDSQNLKGIENVDDEDEENDADFELELEEALESEPNEIEEQLKTRLRQKASLDHSKVSGQSNRPLRPLLPFSSIGSFPTHDGKLLLPNISPPYKPPVNNGLVNGFTPHQIGQLHCLIHEHVQLLIQIFSICALKPGKGHIATELQKLILDMLHKCDEVLAWRRIPYPSFCFFPPYIHPSLQDELPKILPPQCNKEMPDTCDIQQQDRLFTSNTALHSDTNSPSKERDKHLPSKHAICFQTRECTSWVPYISGPVLSVLDVAPLRLVGNYIDDISSAVRAYERCQIGVGFDTQFEREPLFPLCNFPCSSESDGHGLSLSSPASKKIPKKTMAATLIEKAKNQTVALVPKEIAKLAQRFCPLFNPVLYPYKPPPASLTSRVFFTDSEDELLALGLMEYNTDWKAIQQRFLPCKSKHQIFIRQKNRASSKAPENPIKAVRRIKNSPLTSDEIARIEVGLKKFKLDWISIWRFFVPYRDPSLLPRQWRIALGTQKSYKSDANKKAKRRLYESKRRASKPSVSIRHSSPEKEDFSKDNAKEGNNADNCMDWEDEAYVHEAFLADWRPDNSNISSKFPTRLPSLVGSQVREEMDNSGGGDIHTQSCTNFSSASRFCGSQVVLRPYRARRANNARLVKLAPDLPPVNLPPSVRIMSQSAFKCSQGGASTKIPSNGSLIGGTMAENTALQVVRATKSAVDFSVKPGQIRSISTKNSICNQHQNSERLRNKCLTEERGYPDLQMHPLLFQAPKDGALQYYPLNSSTSTSSSFSLFSGNQPQINLGLFHNPLHLRDAVNFLTKPSKPLEKKSSSLGMDFHPLLQRADDVDSDMLASHSAAKWPSNAVSRQRGGSLSASCSKLPSHSGKSNELDLDIHLSFTSRNDTENCIDRSVNAAIYGSIESESANDSREQRAPTPEGVSDKLDSGDHVLDTSTNERSRKFVDEMCEESLPEIVMEHEELSDSDEEFGENVEFEHEEMMDSEGVNTSDSEQFVDIPNEEVHQDITDADSDDQNGLHTNGDPGGSINTLLDDRSTELGLAGKGANNESSTSHLNLNFWPPVSPIVENATTTYTFGTFAENQVPASSKRSVKPEISRTGAEKRSKVDYPALRKPSKQMCRPDSNLRSVSSEKGNSSSTIDKSRENPKNGTKDEFG